jgi:hypothetical protein
VVVPTEHISGNPAGFLRFCCVSSTSREVSESPKASFAGSPCVGLVEVPRDQVLPKSCIKNYSPGALQRPGVVVPEAVGCSLFMEDLHPRLPR